MVIKTQSQINDEEHGEQDERTKKTKKEGSEANKTVGAIQQFYTSDMLTYVRDVDRDLRGFDDVGAGRSALPSFPRRGRSNV